MARRRDWEKGRRENKKNEARRESETECVNRVGGKEVVWLVVCGGQMSEGKVSEVC